MKQRINMFTLFSGYDSQMMAINLSNKKFANKFNINLVGWSDIDPHVQAFHNLSFPEYADKCYPDVTKIDWQGIEDLDILFYSSPCQSVSRAGCREGIEKDSETESSLLWAVEKGIAEKRPKWCIMENVEGLLDPKFHKNFVFWLRTIASYGYTSYYKVLSSEDYGTPQHRTRVILISIRNDQEETLPEFLFPEKTTLTTKPEDLLSENVDDKYYLTIEETNAFMDLMDNAKKGYVTFVDTHGHNPTKHLSSEFVRHISSMVSPVCKGGSIPTLMASTNGGALTALAGCRREGCPCVVEVWEKKENMKPSTLGNIKPMRQKMEALHECKDRLRVLKIKDGLKENQYIRIRRLTPEESLRFMGVEDKYIQRMTDPYNALAHESYTKDEITNLITINGKVVKLPDSSIYGRAGNSIVVNVLVGIFDRILDYYVSSTSFGTRNAINRSHKSKKDYAKAYYQRHKEECRKKSREYHRARREQQKLLKVA